MKKIILILIITLALSSIMIAIEEKDESIKDSTDYSNTDNTTKSTKIDTIHIIFLHSVSSELDQVIEHIKNNIKSSTKVIERDVLSTKINKESVDNISNKKEKILNNDSILLIVSILCLIFLISTIRCLIVIKRKNRDIKSKVNTQKIAYKEGVSIQKSQLKNQNISPKSEQVIENEPLTTFPKSIRRPITELDKPLQPSKIEDKAIAEYKKNVKDLEQNNKELLRSLQENVFCYDDLLSQIKKLIESKNNTNIKITHFNNKSGFSHADDEKINFVHNNLTKDAQEKFNKHRDSIETLSELIGNLFSEERYRRNAISSLNQEIVQLQNKLDEKNSDIQVKESELENQKIEFKNEKIKNERLNYDLKLLSSLETKYKEIKKEKSQLEKLLSISQESERQIKADKEKAIEGYEAKIQEIKLEHSESFVESCLQRYETIFNQIKEEAEILDITNDYMNYLSLLGNINVKNKSALKDYLNNLNRIRLISLYKDSKINSLHPIINILFKDLISVAKQIYNFNFLYPKTVPLMFNDTLITKPDGTLLSDNISFESKKYSILNKFEPDLFKTVYDSLDSGSIYEVETMCIYDDEHIYTNLTIFVKQ